MRVVLFACLSFCLSTLVYAGPDLQGCKLAEDYAPHSFPDREAPGERLVRMAVEKSGGTVTFFASPWPRCLEGIKSGDYDLILGPSPDPKFFSYIEYPRSEGQPDPVRSLGPVEYMLFKQAAKPLDWDGREFQNLTSPVFYGDKAVIVRTRLESLGIESDDSALDMDQLIEMLYYDRTDVIVMRKYEGLSLIAEPRYQGRFTMFSEPIVSFNSYLGASKQIYASEPEFIEAVWFEMGVIRKSPQWDNIMGELLTIK